MVYYAALAILIQERLFIVHVRKRGRVVEGTGLENRRGFAPSVSSNLTASATDCINPGSTPLRGDGHTV